VTVYRHISGERAHCNHPVCLMCELLGVSESGYWAWCTRPPSDRALGDAWLTEQIRRIHQASSGRYGSPRVQAMLAREGIRVGEKRVERLMRVAGLQGAARRSRKGCTVSCARRSLSTSRGSITRPGFTARWGCASRPNTRPTMPPAIPTASRAHTHTRARVKKLFKTFGFQQQLLLQPPDSTKPGEVQATDRVRPASGFVPARRTSSRLVRQQALHVADGETPRQAFLRLRIAA
jgi:hypothetical protein